MIYSGHFLVVMTNSANTVSANAEGAGVKFMLGSADTVQYSVSSGGGGKAPSANTLLCQGEVRLG